MTKYASAAFFNGSDDYQDRRLKLAQLLAEKVDLNTKMIGRIIVATPEFFDSDIEWAEDQLEKLRVAYERLGGTNFQMFCRVQLAQSIRLLDRRVF